MPFPHDRTEHGFFSGLPSSLAERVRRLGRVRRAAAGAVIHQAGDPARDLVLIEAGRVALSRTGSDGKRIVLSVLEPGETIGLFPLMTGRARSYDADAADDCRLRLLTRRDLDMLIDAEPALRNRVIAILSDRLARVLDALEDERRLPLVKRMAKLLLREASREGLVRRSQFQLAEELASSRFAAGNALKELGARGFAESGYGRIRVIDADGMRRWVNRAG